MNPLLNRLYQTKSRNKSLRVPRNRLQSANDRQLIPKMQPRSKIQQIEDMKQQRQKTTMLKNYVTKLPAIAQTTKHIPQHNQTKKSFRQRKLSSKLNQYQTAQGYFPTQLSIGQKPIQQKQYFQASSPRIHQRFSQQIESQNNIIITSKSQSEDELFQYLRVIQQNQDLVQQFCYMNRGQLPYSYYIVEYDDRNPLQYLTVSLRGITLIKGSQTQFCSIKTMSKQIQRYRAIKQIPFFRQYLAKKVLKHWYSTTIMRKFQSQCRFITANLFSQNPQIKIYLSFLHNIAQDFSHCKFLDIQIHSTKQLHQLEKLLNQKSKNIIETIHYYQNQIERQLKDMIQKALIKFRQEKRVTLGTAQKLQGPFLPYDNKKKDMKYTQMAKLKQFQGCMYRVIKYTDILKFNIKLSMLKDGLKNYLEQLQFIYTNYLKKQSLTFVCWINVKVHLTKSQENQSTYLCKPLLNEIKQTLTQHRQQIMNRIFKDHKLLIDRKDDFNCQEYNQQLQQRPSRLDLKYFAQKQDIIIQLNQRCENSLLVLLNLANQYLQNVGKQIIFIYDDSILEDINNYMTNQKLRVYLEKYAKQRQFLNGSAEDIDLGLIMLHMGQPLKIAKNRFQQKFKKITTAIPTQVLRRCQQVCAQVKLVYNQFKQNPLTIAQYLTFIKKFQQSKPKLQDLQNMIEGLLQLQQMSYKNGIRIGQVPKLHIQQCSIFYKQLIKRFQQIQNNQQNDRKKFENSIQSIIPVLQQRAQVLYKDLYSDNLITSPFSNAIDTVRRLHQQFGDRFQKIKSKKQQLFCYQQQLSLGHNQIQNYFKLQRTLQWFFKLWQGKQELDEYKKLLNQRGYSQLLTLDIKPLLKFAKNIQDSSTDIQVVQLLQEFRTQVNYIIKIIKLCKLISAQTLQQQHCQQLKKIIIVKSGDKLMKDDLLTSHGGRTILPMKLVNDTNIMEVQSQIQQIVFLSAQESIIKKKLFQMEEYWKKARIKIMFSDASKSGAEIPHLDQAANQQFHEKLGAFTLTLKNIEGSSHDEGIVAQKVIQQTKICTYFRTLLQKWGQVQSGWLKLLPLMTNCPSVKHQSNVYFEFTSLDNTLKKICRQTNQMTTIKKYLDDINDKKYLQLFQKCQKDLIDINHTFQLFLENKRSTYNRFYFLADNQLITILQNIRDVHSFAKYSKLCFNCQRIVTQKQLVCGFQTQYQIFRLRKTILRGQPQQMFRSIQDNMKTSIKIMVQSMIPKAKIGQNLQQQFIDNPLQVMLLVDKILWSEMSENYLNSSSYQDYLLLLRKPYQQLVQFLIRCNKDQWIRVAHRLTQSMLLKSIGEQLIRDQVSRDDFKWKEQLKYTIEDQQIIISQFNKKMQYGYEYYPPSARVLVPTDISNRLIMRCFQTCSSGQKNLLIQGQPGQGKGYLSSQMATIFGYFKRNIVCHKNISIHYLMRFVQGSISAGAWLTFYQIDKLDYSVLGKLLEVLGTMKFNQKCHPRTLFCLVTHGQYTQRVNIYGFTNFMVVQPEKKKICQWLLKIYKFKDQQILSKKLMGYLQIVKPFLDKMLGSRLSILRRVLERAGDVKLNSQRICKDEDIIAQAIIYQLISKSSQRVRINLQAPLKNYFQYQLKQQKINNQFDQLLNKLKQLIKSKQINNILLIGQRNCKSQLLKLCLKQQNKLYLKIYPQCFQQFFGYSTIQYLNNLQQDQIIIYDGNDMILQWNDLISSSQIYIQGQKIKLKNKLIIQLRSLQSCSPSMVLKCQIIYTGNILTKKQRFILTSKAHPQSSIVKNLQELFGQKFQNLKQELLDTLSLFLQPYTKNTGNKSIQKIIIWIVSLLDNQNLWSRQYGGRPIDYTIHDLYQQLVPIDRAKYNLIPTQNPQYFFVPTKYCILVLQLINNFLSKSLHVELSGAPFSGKTTLLSQIKPNIILSTYKPSHIWSSSLKKSYITIRKQGKNYLIKNQDIKIIIDDIDLGNKYHSQYIRRIIDQHSFRDDKFQEYFFQKFHILITSRKQQKKLKLLNRVSTIKLQTFSKQSLNTIFIELFHKQIKILGMNRQVQQIIQNKVIKCLLICFQDLCNVYSRYGDIEKQKYGIGVASIGVIGVLKNLLSLPKRNAYISSENYQKYFNMHIWARLRQKNFTKRLQWQLQSLIDNALKVTFQNQQKQSPSRSNRAQKGKNRFQNQFWLYTDKQIKLQNVEKIKQNLQQKFPYLMIFQQMLWEVLKLSNQYNCIDGNCLMVGRKGVGKRYTFQVSAAINQEHIEYNLSNAICCSLQGTRTLLYQQYIHGKQLSYQKLMLCQNDNDLENYLDPHHRQKYRDILSGLQQKNSTRLINKIKQHIKNIIAIDTKSSYDRLTNKIRIISQWPVCQLHQWPKQALVGISLKQVTNKDLHATLFIKANQIILNLQLKSMPIIKYQKYLQIYQQIYQKNYKVLNDQLILYTQINQKFANANQLVQNWQRRVNFLQAQLQLTISDLDKAIQANQIQSFTIATLSKQLQNQQKQLQKKNQQLKQVKQQSENKLHKMQRVMNRITKMINSLQRAQLGQLKKVYKTNIEIMFQLQCLCLLMQQQQSQKGINKILADPNLLMKMKSQNLLNKRNHKYVVKFNKQHKNYQNLFKQVSIDSAKILYDWLKALIQYWDIHQIYQIQDKSYKNLLNIYNQSLKQMSKIKDIVQDMNKRMKICIVDYQHYVQKKKQSQIQLSRIQQKLNNVKVILPVLDKSYQQTKKIIKDIKNKLDNLVGNCIFCAYSIVYLPMRKIQTKSIMLKSIQKVLKDYLLGNNNVTISYWENFSDGIQQMSDSGWQAINILALKYSNAPKVIFDPERRALSYLMDHSYDNILENIIQKAQNIKNNDQEYQKNKIYHTTMQLSFSEEVIVIDWKYTAFNIKQAIQNRIAQHKKPQYFEAKKTLALRIRKNMIKLDLMKKTLYQKICEQNIKILQDYQFIDIGINLLKLYQQTQQTKKHQQQKIQQIKNLSKQIQLEINKILIIYQNIKKISRNVSIDVMLSYACTSGDIVQNVLKWGLSEVDYQKRYGLLLGSAIEIYRNSKNGKINQQLIDILLDKSQLKQRQEKDKSKIKKPSTISTYNWETLQKLSPHSQNFIKLLEKAIQHQKQFQVWCKSATVISLPQSFDILNLSIQQHLIISKYFKNSIIFQKTILHIAKIFFQFSLEPFTSIELIQRSNPRYPFLIYCQYQQILILNKQLNSSKIIRKNINQIISQTDMKKIVWNAMEKGLWLILNGISNQQTKEMAQNIIYYVMNYDYQEGFRVFLYIDNVSGRRFQTQEQKIIFSSQYIQSIGIKIRQYNYSLSQYIDLFKIQIEDNFLPPSTPPRSPNSPQNPPPPEFTLYRLYLLVFICHILLKKYNKNLISYRYLQKSIDRINYIAENQLILEFNIDSIAQHIGKIYSLSLPTIFTKSVQQIFQRLIQQTKINDRSIYGLQLMANLDNVYESLDNNLSLIGCTESQFKRKSDLICQNSLKLLYKILYQDKLQIQDKLIQIRGVLVRVPNQLVFAQNAQSQYLRVCYGDEILSHNQRIKKVRDFIEWLNMYSNKSENQNSDDNVQNQLKFDWNNLHRKIAQILGYSVMRGQIKSHLQKYIDYLRKQHQFLLYWRPNPSSFSINPFLVDNVQKIVSSYLTAHFQKSNKMDAHNYQLQPQFTMVFQQKDVFTQQGILLTGLNYREFKYSPQSKNLDPLYENSQKCSIILLKSKKNIVKEQDEITRVRIKICNGRRINKYMQNGDNEYNLSLIETLLLQNQIYSFEITVENVFPQWNLRNCLLMTND